jgi:hypothetical protein
MCWFTIAAGKFIMKQIKIFLNILILSSIIGLNGCSSGNSSTDNNNDAAPTDNRLKTQASVENTPIAQPADDSHISFIISNQSDRKIGYAIIKSEDGTEVYNGNLSCDIHKSCNIKIDKQSIHEDLTFEFLGDNNKLVSASIWLYNTENTAKIYADDTMLGIYLFKQMKHRSNSSEHAPTDLAAHLVKLFKIDDFFEGLAIDYKLNVLDTGLEKEQFYNKLETEITNNTLPANELTPIEHFSHLATTSANTASMCEVPSLGSGLGVMSQLSRLVPPPIGPVVGTIYGLGQIITSEACKTNTVGKAIADLNRRIDEIDIKIKALEYGLNDLSNIINETAIQGIINNYDRSDHALQNLVDIYLGVYTTEGKENEYTNLADFARKNGGVKKISDVDQNFQFQNVLANTGSYLSNYDALISHKELEQLSTHLENLCRDQTKIAGDAINKRLKCNLIVASLVTRTNILEREIKLVLQDIITTVLTVRNEDGELDEAWLAKKGIKFDNNKPWADAYAVATNKIEAKLGDIENTLIDKDGKKLFDPLVGISTGLSDNMINKNCFSVAKYIDTATGLSASNDLPNILEFHASTPNGQPYIVTNCSNGRQDVKSKYYLAGGNNIADVFGVLVPFNFIPTMALNANYWPDKFSAASLNIPVPEASTPLSTARFQLHANYPYGTKYPLAVNSQSVRVFGYTPELRDQTHAPDLNVIRDNEYLPVYPVYAWGISTQRAFYPLAHLEGASSVRGDPTSTLLKPDRPDSKTDFSSTIYNGRSATLNEIVYLSFVKNGITYAFGLSIYNSGHTTKAWPWSDYSGGYETINLVCLSNTQCHGMAKPLTIEWWDGTYVSLHQTSPTDIILYMGPAQKAASNEEYQ